MPTNVTLACKPLTVLRTSNAEDTVRCMDTLGRFSASFDKGDYFADFLFAFLHKRPPLKRGLR